MNTQLVFTEQGLIYMTVGVLCFNTQAQYGLGGQPVAKERRGTREAREKEKGLLVEADRKRLNTVRENSAGIIWFRVHC